MNRAMMFEKIRQYSFALLDTHLYLDTHPNDTAALAYYKKIQALYDEIYAKYVSQYPPITPEITNDESWQWVEGPWPWHLEANNMEE